MTQKELIDSIIDEMRPWGEERQKFLHPARVLGQDSQESAIGTVSLEGAPDEALFWPQSEPRILSDTGYAQTLETLDVVGSYHIRSVQKVPCTRHYKLVLAKL